MVYITRVAPSPTGMMHVGTARTALFNYLAAKASGGKFILRIDDTDQERHNEDAINPIYEGLKWLGLNWNTTFRQSDNRSAYERNAKLLVDKGLAITLDNGAIALRWNNSMPKTWHDTIAGDIAITDTNKEQIDNKLILLRGGDKLGQPTYQFASTFDDWNWGINYIIRGVDHTSNTPKQIAIWCALNEAFDGTPGFHRKDLPKFAHVGLIFREKKKMSKRDGKAASLLDYREAGYDPDGVFNFLLRLGWAPSMDNKEHAILDRNRAIDMFLTNGRMRNSNASFDDAKLNWYDKVHKALKAKPNAA